MNPSAVQIIRLIATREIAVRLRDKAFLISTVVLLALVTGSVAIPLFLQRGHDRPKYTLAVAGPQASAVGNLAKATGQHAIALADRQRDEQDSGPQFKPGPAVRTGAAAAPPVRLTLRTVPGVSAAESLVRDKSADGALVLGSTGQLTLIGDSNVEDDLAQLITIAAANDAALSALQQAGLSTTQIQQLASISPPQIRLLDPPSANADIATGLGIAFSVLFFLTSFSYGLLIAQSVVEEKQSRVVELLVSAVPVRLILTGKVLGTTALALGQVVLLLAVALATASAAGASAVVTLLLHSGGWFLLFFVLGFTMLSCLWAAAGAICARQEELQSATVPLQVLLMVPFLISTNVNEPGPWLTVMSYFPLSSPLSMPRRLLLGDAAWWEPILATAAIVGTGAVLVLIATRLYEHGLLRTGSKISFIKAWRGLST